MGWVLFAQRLKGIWRCLFPVARINRIEPDTPQPSVCYFSYPLPNSFSFKNHPFSKYLWVLQRSIPYAAPIFLTYASVDSRSVRRRCRLSLVAFSVHSSLSRTLRSFKLFKLFSSPCSPSSTFSRFCCCTTTRFCLFFSLLSGLSLYLVIDAYYAPLPRTPSYCPLSLRHYLNIHSLHAITSPASSFWSGFTSLLICLLLITFYVSYPDALLDLYDFAFEPLTSW